MKTEIKECKWYRENDDWDNTPFWNTDCGISFDLPDDDSNLTEHNFRFCPNCGRKINEIIE